MDLISTTTLFFTIKSARNPVHSNALINHRNWLLTVHLQSPFFELVTHDRLVDGLKQARAEPCMDFESNIDNVFCNFILAYGSNLSLTQRRKDAKKNRKGRKSNND